MVGFLFCWVGLVLICLCIHIKQLLIKFFVKSVLLNEISLTSSLEVSLSVKIVTSKTVRVLYMNV